jgi:predicted  nucleic acid-binding Zn-ribbon protein
LLIPGRPHHLTSKKEVPEFLTIKEEREGIYEINVVQLLQNNEDNQTPLVVGTEGVFVIKGLDPNKKR